jgi:hypothetical protein
VDELLRWVLAVTAIVTGVLVLTIALTVWRLRRRNRVSPSVATAAPLDWLWSLSAGARLHRRLQVAVRAVRADVALLARRGRPTPALASLVAELEEQAVAVDDGVVAAARHGKRQRRQLLAALDPQVLEIEALSSRLAALAREQGRGPVLADEPAALERISQRLDALEAARQELATVESDSGLRSEEWSLPSSSSGPNPPASPTWPAS